MPVIGTPDAERGRYRLRREMDLERELMNESFGTRIESTQPIIVERSLYSNANGITWAAGTNATATRLPEPR
jgi:hypothetical protein